MNSRPAARGIQEEGITQHRDHSFAKLYPRTGVWSLLLLKSDNLPYPPEFNVASAFAAADVVAAAFVVVILVLIIVVGDSRNL